MEISSVIMVRKIKPTLDKNTPIEIIHRIVKNEMTSKYKIEQQDINEDSDRAVITEYKNADKVKLIDKFAIEREQNQ